MLSPHIRPYHTTDRENVLLLLDLNTPKYFAAEEKKDFIFYLDNEIEYYYVVELDNAIIACGGFNFAKDDTNGFIAWDIVHPDFQGKGVGKSLLNFRIEQLQSFDSVNKITVRTSQHVFAFYEKAGFKLVDIKENYWADGFDLYQMEIIIL
jgi:ribosomal-protein-alanine N-acetyltransferase